MSPLSQGSSKSHQCAFPDDRPDVCGGENDLYDRDDYMETRLNGTLFLNHKCASKEDNI